MSKKANVIFLGDGEWILNSLSLLLKECYGKVQKGSMLS